MTGSSTRPGGVLRWADDTGSLPVALLLVLVGTALSALLAPIVLTQITATRIDSGRVRALHAAETGLDVALGQIRVAQDSNGDGVLSKLPCGPIAGEVGAGGVARYQVTIDYLRGDPQGKSDEWITANRIECATGGGTPSTPAFALLRAQGTDNPAGSFSGGSVRSLEGTYTFSTSNQNIAGGLIHVYKIEGSKDLCLDAGSSAPAAGTAVRLQACSAGSSRQKFAYEPNLNLVLVSSRSASRPLGLCIDAGDPHKVGNIVRLENCAETTEPRQQWSYNSNFNFEGTTDGVTLDGFCLNVETADTPGSRMLLGRATQNTCHKPYSITQGFSPEGTVGAGAAGPDNQQLVNFKEFGRCMDVTGGKLNSSYLIVWPCKQAPNPSDITWNQKWELPAIASGADSAVGRIITRPEKGKGNGGDYCLRSPLSTATGSYVDVGECPADATPPNMTWTVRGDTGTYATSYTIIDSSGYCVQPTDPDAQPPDFHHGGESTSKLVVAACNGSTLQKWNAPPDILRSIPLKDIGEK